MSILVRVDRDTRQGETLPGDVWSSLPTKDQWHLKDPTPVLPVSTPSKVPVNR